MDFYTVAEKIDKQGNLTVYPSFKVVRTKDLMIRGGAFYAVWDEEQSMWSTDEFDVQRLVDQDILKRYDELSKSADGGVTPLLLRDFSSQQWATFTRYLANMPDSYTQLDQKLIFANTEVKKNDFASRRLPYALGGGSIEAWDELVGTLYDPSERHKLEWAIGGIVGGGAKDIQKFLVLYGSAGTGKSTILNIVQDLFEGYHTTFNSKDLTGQNNAFSTEVFKSSPLVAIEHDGDLSRIQDNTKLNSIVSHEDMVINEKHKSAYTSRVNAFLFLGTNKPVRITDAKSGIIRRLIDVHPTGNRIPAKRYQALMSQVKFELGAIAQHCLDIFNDAGKNYYDGYKPTEMMLQTDVFFNYIEAYFDVFKEQDGVSLKQAYILYKQFCEETLVEYKLAQYKFREELKNYFHEFHDKLRVDGVLIRSWYQGFIVEKFKQDKVDHEPVSLTIDKTESIFDETFSDELAQYASPSGIPQRRWDEVESTLADIDTSEVHYVKVPENHIVIDFDIKGDDGKKSLEKNLEAASQWPSTYSEFSKSGSGIHLHYNYDGPTENLSRIFADDIEIKVFNGNASLRRKLSLCNDRPIATLSGGLPMKEKKVIDSDTIQSEKGLRTLIEKNLRKEIHGGTKPSIDFIHKLLEDAYNTDGFVYDLTDLRPRVMAFANNSTNQALYCLKLLQQMKFASEEGAEAEDISEKEGRIAFFDVEVFPNLLIVCWKYQDSDTIVRMVNPTPQEIEELVTLNLVGFNNRRYDNHILYGRIMGMDNQKLYELSQKIVVKNDRNALFGAGYGLSYADIYDFSSKKQSLKKFQVELGILHKEWGGGWDEPVPEEKWTEVAEYCANDVLSTEAVFKARYQDFVARKILSDISGLTPNDTTQKHTAKIIFGDDLRGGKHKEFFEYTDLSEMFPGYIYDYGKSSYRDEDPSEGGYVYAEPGYFQDVAVLDVASMHPTSIIELNLFGKYTKNFKAIMDARLAIKRGDYDTARKTFNGLLKPYLKSNENAEALSYALKIVINIVYGLTSAKFDNPFLDKRNKDNIVAKRGALFMIDLKHFVQEKGFTVAHIKTDSIKIPGATPDIIDLVMEFGHDYGYEFEHEATYERMLLANDAVYIAKTAAGKRPPEWVAVGAQFQHPYIFKTLFTREELEFADLCEAKSVTTAMYLDFDTEKPMHEWTDNLRFVGKTGSFVPIQEGRGGGTLLVEREVKGEKALHSVTGASGYLWLEAEMVKEFELQEYIDYGYFENLVYKAKEQIEKHIPLKEFIDEEARDEAPSEDAQA